MTPWTTLIDISQLCQQARHLWLSDRHRRILVHGVSMVSRTVVGTPAKGTPPASSSPYITRVATYIALLMAYARTNRNALSWNPAGVTAWIDLGNRPCI